ncbi:MAG: hypothetical protein FWF97_01000 [Alphaproteobacteria bacterium]|nr:hypothetical protein [Alphaproteobacteria bacterium]
MADTQKYPKSFEEVLKMAMDKKPEKGRFGDWGGWRIMANAGKAEFIGTPWSEGFPKTLDDAKHLRVWHDNEEFFEMFINADADNSAEARDFLQRANLIGAVLDNNFKSPENMIVFLKNVKSLTDEQLKYNVLKQVSDHNDKKINYDKNLMLAQSPFVTTNDLQHVLWVIYEYNDRKDDLAQWSAEQREIAAKVANDLLALADKELRAELAKDIPDTQVFKDLERNSDAAIKYLPAAQDYKEKQNLEKEIAKKFDVNQLLGDTEYIAKYDQSVLLKNEELKAEIEKLNREKEENAAQQQRDSKYRTELEQMNARLQGEITGLENQLSEAKNTSQNTQSKLAKLQEAVENTSAKTSLKTGRIANLQKIVKEQTEQKK